MREQRPSPARLEAFSDGVIAVIITVMGLEIKVPRANGLAGLRELAPALLIYLLSFSFTGIYWLNHQTSFAAYRGSRPHDAMRESQLSFLSFSLPLSTAYVIEKQLSSFAVAVYAASLLIVALSFMWLRLSIHVI